MSYLISKHSEVQYRAYFFKYFNVLYLLFRLLSQSMNMIIYTYLKLLSLTLPVLAIPVKGPGVTPGDISYFGHTPDVAIPHQGVRCYTQRVK
jgi:hypothetical protein